MADKTTCWNCGIRYEYSRFKSAKCPDCGELEEDMPWLSGREEEDELIQTQLREIQANLEEVEQEFDEDDKVIPTDVLDDEDDEDDEEYYDEVEEDEDEEEHIAF